MSKVRLQEPDHYNLGDYQVIDVIKDSSSKEEYYGFLYGNVLKYILRHKKKHGKKDLIKAKDYLNLMLQELE